MYRKKFSVLPFVPNGHSIVGLRRAAKQCKGCHLYKMATQTVFGEGNSHAAIMFVGEQPGDHEDLEGKPFVGPAGKLLAACMDEANIDRRQVYLTNVVKHFKWEPRGKRRIHEKPNQTEIAACRPWLELEIESIRPKIIVALGATAAKSLLGKSFRVTKQRGQIFHVDSRPILATVHPSSLLRQATGEDRAREIQRFTADLKKITRFISGERQDRDCDE